MQKKTTENLSKNCRASALEPNSCTKGPGIETTPCVIDLRLAGGLCDSTLCSRGHHVLIKKDRCTTAEKEKVKFQSALDDRGTLVSLHQRARPPLAPLPEELLCYRGKAAALRK